MTASDVLEEAHRRGLTITPEGGDLRIRPGRLVTSEFANRLRACKPELLALLMGDRTPEAPELVKPYRPLTERERVILVRFCGNENDPIIITALNLFHGRIVG